MLNMDSGKKDPKHKNARINRTKKALIDAVFHLLSNKDFVDITVNDICNIAEVSRATFYIYFEDKYHLLKYSLKQFSSQASKDSKDFNMEEYLTLTLNYFVSYEKSFRRLFLGNSNRELINLLQITIIEEFTEFLNQLEEKGQKFHAPISIVAIFLGSGFYSLLLWWLSHGFPYTEEEMVQHICNFFEATCST